MAPPAAAASNSHRQAIHFNRTCASATATMAGIAHCPATWSAIHVVTPAAVRDTTLPGHGDGQLVPRVNGNNSSDARASTTSFCTSGIAPGATGKIKVHAVHALGDLDLLISARGLKDHGLAWAQFTRGR
jgi:hypothetical protein